MNNASIQIDLALKNLGTIDPDVQKKINEAKQVVADTMAKLPAVEIKFKLDENKRKEELKKALELGDGIGKSLTKGLHAVKFENVLAGSLQALLNYEEYKEKLKDDSLNNVQPIKVDGTISGSAQDLRNQEEQTAFLSRMADGIDRLNGKDPVVLTPTDATV